MGRWENNPNQHPTKGKDHTVNTKQGSHPWNWHCLSIVARLPHSRGHCHRKTENTIERELTNYEFDCWTPPSEAAELRTPRHAFPWVAQNLYPNERPDVVPGQYLFRQCSCFDVCFIWGQLCLIICNQFQLFWWYFVPCSMCKPSWTLRWTHIYTLMGMACMMPLPEAIDSLVTFLQSCDIVVICNLIATLKVWEGPYTLYYDRASTFKSNKFFGYKRLIDGCHKSIHLRW